VDEVLFAGRMMGFVAAVLLGLAVVMGIIWWGGMQGGEEEPERRGGLVVVAHPLRVRGPGDAWDESRRDLPGPLGPHPRPLPSEGRGERGERGRRPAMMRPAVRKPAVAQRLKGRRR
jgi:hypothetical protein